MARLMKSELIRVLHETDSTRVVLNDAAHHNKLSVELVEELIGVVEDLNTNPTGRLMIEGSHATFCAGFVLRIQRTSYLPGDSFESAISWNCSTPTQE